MARLTPIRLALLQEDRTQAWLAEQVEISRPEMSRIVGGLVPDDAVMEKVCRVLSRPQSVLFPHVSDGSDQKPVSSTPSSELAA